MCVFVNVCVNACKVNRSNVSVCSCLHVSACVCRSALVCVRVCVSVCLRVCMCGELGVWGNLIAA